MTPAEIAALSKKLPFDLQEAITNNPRTLMLYGPPKVGKTSSITYLQNAVIIPTERGADTYACTRTPLCTNYADFMKVCDTIIAAGKPYKYVVVDTIDEMEAIAMKQATVDYKAALVGKEFNGTDVCTELPMGAGYLWLRRALLRMLDKLFHTTPDHGTVILIGHVKDKLLKDAGKDVTAADVNLTGKCAQIVCAECDAIGHMTRRTRPPLASKGQILQDLYISFKTSEHVNCGSRIAHLAGQDILFADAETRVPKWDLIFK